jgi:predicted phage-related endonuclease
MFHAIKAVPGHKRSNQQTSFSPLEEDVKSQLWRKCYEDRRSFIGGSDARIIMGSDEVALIRLWREKRGETEPENLSGNLIVQLGAATEELNRSWYERNTGRRVTNVQRRVRHSAIPWMVATLDGIVEGAGAVFEAKFMLPWSFSEEAAAEKYMPQVQHNMWVTHLRSSVLSIITGGGKWVEITIPMDPLYLSVLVSAEKKFWRCVQCGEPPHLINAEPPRPPRIEAVRIVDMSSSNSWAEFAALFRNTRSAFLDHERAKSELKALMPEDAKEAIGHGVKAKRSKSGAVSFDVLETEATHAPVQGTASAASAMRRSPAGSRSCARRWGSTR